MSRRKKTVLKPIDKCWQDICISFSSLYFFIDNVLYGQRVRSYYFIVPERIRWSHKDEETSL